MSTDLNAISRISRLWTVMQANFGSRWLLDYGDAIEPATGHLAPIAAIWVAALETLSNAAIATGLKALINRTSEYPPTLPEFMRLCGARSSHHPAHRLLPAAPVKVQPHQPNPNQRCASLSQALAERATTELTPRLVTAQPSDQPQVIGSYWTTKLAAIAHGKTDDALPPDWRTLAGMPEPTRRHERQPGAIPTVGKTWTIHPPQPEAA